MGRKVKLFVGLSLLIVVALWLANRRGLFRQGSALAATVSATASSIPSTTQPIASAQNPPPLLTRPPVDEDTSTFIALRYDKSHVIFRLGEGGDFSLDQEQEKALRRLQGPVFWFRDERYFERQKSLPAEAAPAWGFGPKLLQSLRRNFKEVEVGEQWQLELSGDIRIPVVVQKPVALPWGCDNSSYTAAFIAEAAPQAQPVLAASPKHYFLVHRSLATNNPQSGQKPMPGGLLPAWNPTPEVRSQIEQAIDAQLRDELAHQQGSGAFEDVRKQFEEKVALGKVKLDYETQALQVSPDGFPLLLVRARWMADQQLALLMTLWLHVGSVVTSEPVDDSGNRAQWFSDKSSNAAAGIATFDQLPYVLNVFDRPGDGYGEVLVFFPGYEGFKIQLFRYTQRGLVATKISIGDGC